jgi:hypothetical protein
VALDSSDGAVVSNKGGGVSSLDGDGDGDIGGETEVSYATSFFLIKVGLGEKFVWKRSVVPLIQEASHHPHECPLIFNNRGSVLTENPLSTNYEGLYDIAPCPDT